MIEALILKRISRFFKRPIYNVHIIITGNIFKDGDSMERSIKEVVIDEIKKRFPEE